MSLLRPGETQPSLAVPFDIKLQHQRQRTVRHLALKRSEKLPCDMALRHGLHQQLIDLADASKKGWRLSLGFCILLLHLLRLKWCLLVSCNRQSTF